MDEKPSKVSQLTVTLKEGDYIIFSTVTPPEWFEARVEDGHLCVYRNMTLHAAYAPGHWVSFCAA